MGSDRGMTETTANDPSAPVGRSRLRQGPSASSGPFGSGGQAGRRSWSDRRGESGPQFGAKLSVTPCQVFSRVSYRKHTIGAPKKCHIFDDPMRIGILRLALLVGRRISLLGRRHRSTDIPRLRSGQGSVYAAKTSIQDAGQRPALRNQGPIRPPGMRGGRYECKRQGPIRPPGMRGGRYECKRQGPIRPPGMRGGRYGCERQSPIRPPGMRGGRYKGNGGAANRWQDAARKTEVNG